jgi:patatin-like phospholipase/acyl hydrolase
MNWPESLKPDAKKQRKLLALDGGGIRGIMTVEILVNLEEMLRKETGGGSDFVLADFFDAVAGTSTGAIIAACISKGMSAERIRRFYIENGARMFDKASLRRRFRYKYEDDKLAVQLKNELGEETTLGDESLRTILMMVLRNATTDSPWPLSNNPQAKYNDRKRADCNLDLPLWRLVRASTAAPTYFPPETVRFANGKYEFVFVDGGITTYNNPAFQLFLMSTIEPYELRWPAGEDKMLLVSVGTGTNPRANKNLDPGDMNLLYNAGSIPSALMFAALNEQDLLCRAFGKCLVGEMIDREVGDLEGVIAPGGNNLFTYMRYNAELGRESLDNLGLENIDPENVQKLDSIEHIEDLRRVGAAVAERDLEREHYRAFLDS